MATTARLLRSSHSETFERLYTSFSFLFLGCSLDYDRTFQTFAKIAQDVGADSLPHHYAILACPSDATVSFPDPQTPHK
jgi:hypothetical protein